MPFVEYENANFAYLTNAINQVFWADKEAQTDNFVWQNTGWHVLENKQWKNFLTPKQWFDLVTNHDRVRIVKCSAIVQNMIPLTDNLSISQDTTFMSFNNTIYALGYTDKCYETLPVESDTNINYREGAIVSETDGTISKKVVIPLYRHPIIRYNATTNLTSQSWDPFCKPHNLMELRPGKNSIVFEWERDSSDDDIAWFSTAKYCSVQNTGDNTNSPLFFDASANHQNEWITPPCVIKNDPRVAAYDRKRGTLYQRFFNKPITNWFLKLIPIINQKNALLKHTAQVCIVRKITFEVTPRCNTTNWPQLDYTFADMGKFSVGGVNYTTAIGKVNHVDAPPFASQADFTDYPYVKPVTPSEENDTPKGKPKKGGAKAYSVMSYDSDSEICK
uniref:Capsid protein n=1 Tax=Phylloscopus proregulus parvoviridae sp. TaxID=2794532 RepID=A0A8A4XD13_9VIRU|nr:MAG: capsid protein [Phylloscopus proregulus parvoviridae sp.]